ncbi:MAG: hypothetical protein M1816_005832 [Peltula sp. TS41687]|nr:MAG: hypothetical protein M1816_005832 [Peltula sp. TS41687]
MDRLRQSLCASWTYYAEAYDKLEVPTSYRLLQDRAMALYWTDTKPPAYLLYQHFYVSIFCFGLDTVEVYDELTKQMEIPILRHARALFEQLLKDYKLEAQEQEKEPVPDLRVEGALDRFLGQQILQKKGLHLMESCKYDRLKFGAVDWCNWIEENPMVDPLIFLRMLIPEQVEQVAELDRESLVQILRNEFSPAGNWTKSFGEWIVKHMTIDFNGDARPPVMKIDLEKYSSGRSSSKSRPLEGMEDDGGRERLKNLKEILPNIDFKKKNARCYLESVIEFGLFKIVGKGKYGSGERVYFSVSDDKPGNIGKTDLEKLLNKVKKLGDRPREHADRYLRDLQNARNVDGGEYINGDRDSTRTQEEVRSIEVSKIVSDKWPVVEVMCRETRWISMSLLSLLSIMDEKTAEHYLGKWTENKNSSFSEQCRALEITRDGKRFLRVKGSKSAMVEIKEIDEEPPKGIEEPRSERFSSTPMREILFSR